MGKLWIWDNITVDNTVNKFESLLVYTEDNYLHNMGKIYRTILYFMIQLIHIKVCSFIYRIISKIIWGNYEYGTILQLIIQFKNFTVCSCIYRICSDRTWGKHVYGTILQLYFDILILIFTFHRSLEVNPN